MCVFGDVWETSFRREVDQRDVATWQSLPLPGGGKVPVHTWIFRLVSSYDWVPVEVLKGSRIVAVGKAEHLYIKANIEEITYLPVF